MKQSARKPEAAKNFGQVMARGSLVAWLCAGGIVYMTREPPIPTGTPYLAGAFIVFGLLFGVVALLSMFKLGVRKILLPALCGVALNSLVLAIAFQAVVQTRSKELSEQYDLKPLTSPVESRKHPYRFEAPAPSWGMRSEAALRKEQGKGPEIWLVDPALDAHLTVFPFVVDEGYEVDTQLMTAEMIKEIERLGVRTEPDRALQARNTTGRQFDGQGVSQGVEIRWRVAGFGSGRHGVKLFCWGPPANFAAFAAACDHAFGSFEFVEERMIRS